MKLETPTPQPKKQPTGAGWIGLLWNWLTRPHPSIKDIAERRKAQIAASLTLVLALVNLIGGLAAAARTPASTMQVFGLPVIGSFIAYLITRTRFVPFGSFLFVVSFCASAYLNILSDSRDIRVSLLFYVPLGLTIGSFLLSSWAVFLVTGLNVGATLILLPALGVTLPENIGGAVGLITAFGIVTIILNNFRNSVERQRLEELQIVNQELLDTQSNLEVRVAERTTELEQRSKDLADRTVALELANIRTQKRAGQLQAISDVARTIAGVRKLTEILPRISRVVSEQFGFYHTGIFLLDESGEYAVLSAANSTGGQRMLARGHRLKVGEQGIVGNVTETGNPRIALDTGADASFFNNPDLPETHSEMAIPLKSAGKIIGALDVQSSQSNAFSQEDLELVQVLADQISIAIDNSRQFDQTQKSLSEAETIYRQYLRREWDKLGDSEKILGYRHSLTGTEQLSQFFENQQSLEAQSSGLIQTENDLENNESSLSVPIKIRDEIIGVLNIRAPRRRTWKSSEVEMVKSVADRVAISAENARLFEETTNRAERERTVSEITSKIRSTNDPNEMIQIALSELKQTLRVKDASVGPYLPPTSKEES